MIFNFVPTASFFLWKRDATFPDFWDMTIPAEIIKRIHSSVCGLLSASESHGQDDHKHD